LGAPAHSSAGEDPRASDARSLATALEPQVRAECGDRLGAVTWFRVDWQRGAAATGRAAWQGAGDEPTTAVVKLPVHPRELRWLRRLQTERPAAVPELLASGDTIGGYDLAWVVIEHLPVGPLAAAWKPAFMPLVAQAIASFSRAAARVPPEPIREPHDWTALLEVAKTHLADLKVESPKAWKGHLRSVERRLPEFLDAWQARTPVEWIHGDLHPANAMSRAPLGEDGRGEVCLIDFAEVRSGHWIEDAAYFERLHWAVPDRLKGHPPIKAIGAARKALGLDNGPEPGRLAAIRRVLMAATAPAFAKTEGSPAYLAACCAKLGEALKTLE